MKMRIIDVAALAVLLISLVTGTIYIVADYRAEAQARDVFMSGCIKMGLDSGLQFSETLDECSSAWTAIENGWLGLEGE